MGAPETGGGAVEELSVSKLDYQLQDYPQLLAKALIAEKGQKGLIKKLYGDMEDVVEKCTVNNLRQAVYEHSFVAVLEGRKLAAAFIPKIGTKEFFSLVKNVIQTPRTTSKTTCAHYGEVFLMAWKNAESDELRKQIEFGFQDIVRFALTTQFDISANFRAALDPLRGARSKQIDPMIERILRPNLWRYLKSVNGIARHNACQLFFLFYPVVKDDDLESAELFGVQLNTIADLLVDSDETIRAEACRQTLNIFSDFWTTFTPEYRKKNFEKIVDELARDVSAEVRVSVYEGMVYMIPCAEALNAVEKALKHIILWGLNDNVTKVRLAALKVLGALRNHRFIKWWNVIEFKHLLERLEVEKADTVMKLISALLVARVFTPSTSPDEIVKKVTSLGAMSRMGVIKLHQCIARCTLISIEQAVEHLITLGTTVYKLARSYERQQSQSSEELDITDSTAISLPESITPLVIDAKKDDNSEGARLWRQMNLLLECITVTWALLREPLNDNKYANKKHKLSRLLLRLFSHLLHNFKNTSLAETVMFLGSTLRGGSELAQISNSMQKELCRSSQLDEKMVVGYIETLANWNLEKLLLGVVNEGFSKVHAGYKVIQLRNKHTDSRNVSDGLINRVMLFLEIMLKSPTIEQNLIQNFHGHLIKFHRDLGVINGIISFKVTNNEEICFAERLPNFSTEAVVRALELRHTLAIILLNIPGNDGEECDKLLAAVHSDIDWFLGILPGLVDGDADEEQLSFLTTVCQAMLRLMSINLDASPCKKDFMVSVGNVLHMFCSNDRAPHVFIVSVLTACRSLFLALCTEENCDLLDGTVPPLASLCHLWMTARCHDDDFDSKGCAGAFLYLLSAMQNQNCLSKELLDDLSKTMFAVSIAQLMETNSATFDVLDPRTHDFEVDSLIELVILRIMIKNYSLLSVTLENFRTALDSNLFFEDLEGSEVLYMFGAQIQFLFLCDINAEKIACGGCMTASKPCAVPAGGRAKLRETISNCFSAIKERMNSVPEVTRSNPLHEQILLWCP